MSQSRSICLPEYKIVKALDQTTAACFGNPQAAFQFQIIVVGNMQGDLQIHLGANKNQEPWR